MKKIILGLVLLLAVSSMSMAQRGSDANKTTSSRVDLMSCCDLTQEQKDKIKNIREDYLNQKDAVLKSRITKEMQDKRIEELGRKKDSDIRNLLTDEQKKQWDEQKSATKDKRDLRGDNRKGNKQGEGYRSDRPRAYGSIWMLEEIELSDKQKEEYKKLVESYKAENEKTRESHRSERIEQEGKKRDALKKILTDEQKKTFDENLKKIDERRETRSSK